MEPEGWRTEKLKALLVEGVKNGYSPVASEHKTGYWVLGLGALGDDGFNSQGIKSVAPTERVKGSLLCKRQ
jgi:type I restriction enzyme S subunit